MRSKVEDYFGRCRLAAFDARATAALNRAEGEYLGIAAKDMKITADEVAGFPLSRIEAGRALPLVDNVNPAWAAALSVGYVMVAQALSGVAKDLTKMSSKSAVKLVVGAGDRGGLRVVGVVDDGDLRALRGEAHRDRLADALRAAGDDRDLVLQSHAPVPLKPTAASRTGRGRPRQ